MARVSRRGVKRGVLYQVQSGPRGGQIWQRVRDRGDPVTLRKRPTFGPSDALLDLRGKEPRQYQADGKGGGLFGRFKRVPFGLDPSTGVVDPERAAVYVADQRREVLRKHARAAGDAFFDDRLRVFFLPDNPNGFSRRFTLGSWNEFLTNPKYRKAAQSLTGGRWVLGEMDDQGDLGVIHLELGEGEL